MARGPRRKLSLENTAFVRRPPAVVFEFLARPGNACHWQTGVVESGLLNGADLGVGARGYEVRSFLGRKFSTTYEFIEYHPPWRLVCDGESEGHLSIRTVATCEARGGGTQIHTVLEIGDRRGWLQRLFRLAWPLVVLVARRQGKSDFARLKRILESEPAPSAAS